MKSTRTNRILIGAAAGIGVLAGAAGISAAVTSGTSPAPVLDRSEAESAAVAEVPGTVIGYEADDEGGRGVWEITVDGADGRRHEVTVDDSGAVVSRDDVDDDDRFDDDHDDDRVDDDHDPALAADAAVSEQQARDAALAEVPGTVARTHIEREDGRVVWDVEVTGDDGLRHELQIDATDATIVEHDIDD